MAATTLWLTPFGQSNNENIQINIDPSQFQGKRGIFGPTILLQFTTATFANPPLDIVLHSLEGWITWPGDSSFHPGILIPSQTIDPNTHMLYAPITDAQIEAIEERRVGDAVVFEMTLRGLATIPNPRHRVAEYTAQQGTQQAVQGPRLETRVVYSQSHPVRIERETWLQILEGLGAGARRLIELPQPTLPSGDNASWVECVRLLNDATQLYRTRQFEQVLGNCRKIIEGVAEVLCNRWGITRDPKKGITVWAKDLPALLAPLWPNDAEDAAMFVALLNVSFKWTSGSHHYGSGIPIREEVSFALSLTTDLLVFGAQILTASASTAP